MLATISPILFGLSWLYWLREIARDVNNNLPEEQPVEWASTKRVPLQMHWLWNEHSKLFPQSPKRTYAAVSFLLLFFIPIAAEVISIFLVGAP